MELPLDSLGTPSTDFTPNRFSRLPYQVPDTDHPSQESPEAILKNRFCGVPAQDETAEELQKVHSLWKAKDKRVKSI